MLPADANNNLLQVAQPVPGTLQRLSPASGSASLSAAFSSRAVAIGVRVRSVSGIGHFRLVDDDTAATIADFTLTYDDSWMHLSLFGVKTDGTKFKATKVSVYAESATVNVDIVEIH